MLNEKFTSLVDKMIEEGDKEIKSFIEESIKGAFTDHEIEERDQVVDRAADERDELATFLMRKTWDLGESALVRFRILKKTPPNQDPVKYDLHEILHTLLTHGLKKVSAFVPDTMMNYLLTTISEIPEVKQESIKRGISITSQMIKKNTKLALDILKDAVRAGLTVEKISEFLIDQFKNG